MDGNDLTRMVFQKVLTGDPKIIKQAEYSLESYVRNKLREGGVARSSILPPLKIDVLDKDEDPTVFKKYMQIEPDSTAVAVPFRGSGPLRFVKGKLLPVYFEKIESETHTVNIAELKNYSFDIRQVLNDQDAKNIQNVEDAGLLNLVYAVADANPLEQKLEFFGGLTKTTWAEATKSFFPDRPLKFGLMNVRTRKEFLKWNYATDMGLGPYGAEAYSKGAIGNPLGVEPIVTIKVDLVPDNRVILFASEEFIGKFYEWQPPTTFIKAEKDWIQFGTYEWIGIGIGNTKSFVVCDFKP